MTPEPWGNVDHWRNWVKHPLRLLGDFPEALWDLAQRTSSLSFSTPHPTVHRALSFEGRAVSSPCWLSL